MFQLSDEQIQIQQAARRLANEVFKDRAAEIDRSEQYPWDNIKDLTDAGFMGMTIPKEYGGLGLTYMDVVLVVEELARVCGVTARIVVEGNMGAIGAITAFGSEKQINRVAPLILAGDKPAICITEPGSGSAATSMTTTAVKRGDKYILNGTKHWITGGGVSKTHLIFAQVEENGERLGIGGFIAVRDEDQGLRVGRREPAMGLRGIPETEIILEDLEIHEDMAVIPPEGLKRGFAGLMNAYNGQRVGAGTVALGIAHGAYDQAMEYVKVREQFDRPIAEFQGLQWMLADMSVGLDAARMMLWRAACSAQTSNTGFPDPLLAAQAKLIASENAVKISNDALQLHGAAGYSRNLPVERMVRDARMFTIGGGTAQMLRNLIAGRILDMKVPQTRDGYSRLAQKGAS
ncbi:Acyl-CoA dehydrogenase [hydrothermal vent metagenome]|uniref:Acyl-CoA dehydrogenase n=1 Tax=hydrothermal vent metagenome TaxID=652676 RepID=A0A3B0SW06_9ZZZZ